MVLAMLFHWVDSAGRFSAKTVVCHVHGSLAWSLLIITLT